MCTGTRPKPTLLLYCQHSLGLGHLIRSFGIARALANTFQVVFLNGGPMPAGVAVPPTVKIVDLPPLGMGADRQLRSRHQDYTVTQAKLARTAFLRTALHRYAPRVLLIELFPFGRKKFAFELLPLLREANRAKRRPLILCSLRDLLVTTRKDQQRHDNRACWLINRYFDGTLIHADPAFVTLEESFRPTKTLRKPVYYTGFVAPTFDRQAEVERERRVLVSAGSGSVGGALFRAAVAAHDALWRTERLPMTIVCGPFLPEVQWRGLERAARSRPGLHVGRNVPNLAAEIAGSSVSVSQCGYNTTMDLLRARTPAIVVPYAASHEDEQSNRARRLERLGLVRTLPSERLNGGRLAAEVRALVNFELGASGLDLDGAAHTARLIARLADGPPATADNERATVVAGRERQ